MEGAAGVVVGGGELRVGGGHVERPEPQALEEALGGGGKRAAGVQKAITRPLQKGTPTAGGRG